jgi:lipid-binding SYLF domain-containing protein
MKNAITLLLITTLAAPAGAQGLIDNLKKGVGKVGDVAKKGFDAAGNAIDSTSELIKDEETPEATRTKLDSMADEVMDRLIAENSEATPALELSAGYAVFDMRRISIFPLSAGYGRGVAVSLPNGARTYMQMGTGGAGAAFGIGGFESQFVIMFETPVDLEHFVQNGYDASAGAGAMRGNERSTTEVKFTDGRSFFVLSKTGWRVNANASGTKYWQDEDLN